MWREVGTINVGEKRMLISRPGNRGDLHNNGASTMATSLLGVFIQSPTSTDLDLLNVI